MRSAFLLQDQRRVYVLLWICAIMLGIMVILGGATRLTGSGLSIVEWQPFIGILPPLSQLDWQILFEKYQNFPEFQKVNFTMTLPEFKSIFWLEYTHRLWGRLMGVILIIASYFGLRTSTLRQLCGGPLLLIWALGMAQGFMGWYMVKSGLVNDPHVSHYRLTSHLLLAFSSFAVIMWSLQKLRNVNYVTTRLPSSIKILIGLLLLTIALGGFVAGLKAGLIYNTFPLMEGQWFPAEGLSLHPWWDNFLNNHATIQFTHRFLATLSVIAAWGFWFFKGKYSPSLANSSLILALLVTGQYIMGICTLLWAVPIGLGVAHQFGAFLLVGVLTHLTYSLSHSR